MTVAAPEVGKLAIARSRLKLLQMELNACEAIDDEKGAHAAGVKLAEAAEHLRQMERL